MRFWTHRSADVWGLGCLVWEVFNGPLQQGSVLKTLAKVMDSLTCHLGGDDAVLWRYLSRYQVAAFIFHFLCVFCHRFQSRW